MKQLLALFLLASPLGAQSPMSADEFDTYTQGKTLYYTHKDETYGAEMYLKDRRVRWSFLDGKCREGIWYPEDEYLCFVYDTDFEPECWLFFDSGDGLSAHLKGDPNPSEVFSAAPSTKPMLCLGPDVGV
ncbi:MAG: hypothetical protein JXR13_02440 [Thalassovita sp.]